MRSVLFLAACCLCLTLPAAATLLVNGSFETSSFAESELAVPAGSNALPGWVITGNTLDLYLTGSSHDAFPASNGVWSVQLAGTPGPSGIQQAFATTPGSAYTVRFDMTGHPGIAATWNVTVSAAGQSTVISESFSDPSETDPQWRQIEWTFIANDSSTTLAFADSGEFLGALIDNASVTPVPEPASAVLVAAACAVIPVLRRLVRK